jgi:hypothetical protein
MAAETPEARAEREIQTEIEEFADQIASDLGPAAGADRVSDADKLRMWGQSDPRVSADPERFKQMLMAGGLPPEALEPNSDQALGIVRANPEIAQVLSQPLDEQMADMVTRLSEYPLRLAVLADLADDPKRHVEEADRLNGLWQKQHASVAPMPVAHTPPTTTAYAPPPPVQAAPPPQQPPAPPQIPGVGAPVDVPPQMPTADLAQMLGG